MCVCGGAGEGGVFIDLLLNFCESVKHYTTQILMQLSVPYCKTHMLVLEESSPIMSVKGNDANELEELNSVADGAHSV